MKNKKFWTSLIALLLVATLLLGLIVSIIPVASAKSSSEIKEQIAEMEKENEEIAQKIADLKDKLDDLDDEQDANKSEIKKLLAQKELLDEQVGWYHAQVEIMNEQVAAYNVLIADKQKELEEAEARLADLNEKNKERIRAMEEDGTLSYWSVLFEANSFLDLLDRLNMVQEIAASDQRRLQELRDAAEEVEAVRQTLLTERQELVTKKDQLAAAQSEMLLKKSEADELLNQLIIKMEELKQTENEYNDLVDQWESEMEAMEEAIGNAKVDLDEALYKEYLATMKTERPTVATGDSNLKYPGGVVMVDDEGIEWVVPCSYKYVSSGYGPRTHPVTGEKDKMHHGVDLAAPCKMQKDGSTNSPILATRAGVVIAATKSEISGWYVTIDHLDGYRSTYLHMCCKPFVEKGDVVVAGEVIGCIGTTGRSTGNHLHFGIYKNGQSVNPMKYIG